MHENAENLIKSQFSSKIHESCYFAKNHKKTAILGGVFLYEPSF